MSKQLTSESKTTEEPTKTWAEETAPPKSNKGGKGARSKRQDNRAKGSNPAKAKAITSQAENRLGLKSTESLLAMKPASTMRPTAVYVDLFGCNSAVASMITRMQNVAQRPLAILLADPNAVMRYRKVVAYLLFARVCAAQHKVSYAAGVPMPLVTVLTSDELRAIDGYMQNIPNFLAWIFTNLGVFEYESELVVPTMPNPDPGAATIQDALRGNFSALCSYIHEHRSQGGANIPAEDEALIPTMSRVYSIATTGQANQRRFNAATEALYRVAISPEEWTTFASINNALAEQKCSVRTLSLSEASGSEIPRVRFNSYEDVHIEQSYYAINSVSENVTRDAIILRIGNDVNLPEGTETTRFIGAYNTAPYVGHDVPAPYLQAQLQMITKNEIR